MVKYTELKTEDENESNDKVRENDLEKRSSISLPHLEEKEKKFFRLVSSGNVKNVKSFISDNPHFNINCVDFQGISALHVAVENRSKHMVSYLLSRNINIGDCALHAIRENFLDITELILEKMKSVSPEQEFEGIKGSAEFPDKMTPLILAAQCNHFEMIEMLLKRGHSIPEPHPPSCRCKEVCRPLLESPDKLNQALQRLEVCRGITGPSYICQTSEDPVLRAFQLCKYLNNCSKAYVEFSAEYRTLSKKCREFAVEILGHCKSTAEVSLILKRKSGCEFKSSFMFPRLILAMDYYQKEFIAHPFTQHIVEEAWSGTWHEWRRKSAIKQSLTVIERIFLQPVIIILCLFMPFNPFSIHWNLPVNKMLNSVASYLIFLTLIFIHSNLAKDNPSRSAPRTGLELVLFVYVLSHMWSLVKLFMAQGFKHVVTVLQNWYDFVTQILFMTVFMFWLIAYRNEREDKEYYTERKFWHYAEPILIAEGIFAIATILAFGRLLLLCQLNYYLGPLQVSLGKMTTDIAKFIIIFFILILAFSTGLCRLYHYYDGMVQTDEVTGVKTQQVSSFVDMKSTVKTLFWGLFTLTPLESSDVIIENIPGTANNTTITPEHTFTQTIGYLCFAVFEVLSVIVILNMLIASMSNTLTKVTDNVDIEWKYGRTGLYLNYMAHDTLPPPFNFFPSFTNKIEWYQIRRHPVPGKKARWSLFRCCYVEEEPDDEEEQNFSALMSQLVQRYFMTIESTHSQKVEDEQITHL